VERQPDLPWAGKAVLKLQSASHDWDKVEETLDRNQRNKLVTKSDANKMRAVIKVSKALECEKNDEASALKLAEDAHKLDPDLVPAAVVAGRILSNRGEIRRATRILERTWRKSPHPDIAEIYGDVRPGDSPRDRLKRVKSLAQIGFSGEEGAFAVARAAIDAQAWDEARKALAPFIENRPSQRLCTLMAEIEQGDKGDTGRVREWLARAVRAPRDPQWTADGFTSSSWLPTSPVTGELGAFQWKVPVELIGTEKEIDFDFGEPAGPVVEAEFIEAPSSALSDETAEITIVSEDGQLDEGSQIRSIKEKNVSNIKIPGDNEPAKAQANDEAEQDLEVNDKKAESASDLPDKNRQDEDDVEIYVPPRPPDDPGPAKKKDEEEAGFFSTVKDRLSGI